MPGETLQLTPVGLDANGQALPATFSWASDNPAVATVDQNGLVTATGYGGTTVWATALQSFYPSTRGSAGIPVGQVASAITVSPASASIPVGSTAQFLASAHAPDGGSIPEAIFVWDTLNRDIATIDNRTGVATGISGGGTTTVLVWVIGPASVLAGAQGTATLTVTNPGVPPDAARHRLNVVGKLCRASCAR
jgi:uncharacterized protein YjdB